MSKARELSKLPNSILPVALIDTSIIQTNILVDGISNIVNGNKLIVKVANNSFYGMTLNSIPIKVLDIFATEQNQWTITSTVSATKNIAKANVWRPVYLNMLSEDVEYEFIYHTELGGFFEVVVPKLYKHLFVPVGNGQEITELQDAFGFVSQFSRASAMDNQFMNVSSGTEYFPNKAQVTITLAQGTELSPVIHTFNKAVRVGENSLNGIEVVNEAWYNGIALAGACIADFSGLTLGTDDLACFNVWKSDLGEVRNITFKFHGAYTTNNQAVINYPNSVSRLKGCKIDITGATNTGGFTVYGFSANTIGETNNLTVYCPVAYMAGLFAVSTGHSISGLTITGFPQFLVKATNSISLYSFVATDNFVPYAFFCDTVGEIVVHGGSSIKAAELIPTYQIYRVRIDSSATLNLTKFDYMALNRFNRRGSIVIAPTYGFLKPSYMLPSSAITISNGDTVVTLKDGMYNRTYIAGGATATIITINLDIGAYNLAALGDNYVIRCTIVKTGTGTLNFAYNAAGNIQFGSNITFVTDTPVEFIYDPIIARWVLLK
jgi:hypothetical protein